MPEEYESGTTLYGPGNPGDKVFLLMHGHVTLSKGSADSFALRNHGMKAMIPDIFPTGAFPTAYALKDVSYALDLARETGIAAPGAALAEARMQVARDAGFAEEYFPVLARVVDRA